MQTHTSTMRSMEIISFSVSVKAEIRPASAPMMGRA
jgi:hypothetical protein